MDFKLVDELQLCSAVHQYFDLVVLHVNVLYNLVTSHFLLFVPTLADEVVGLISHHINKFIPGSSLIFRKYNDQTAVLRSSVDLLMIF